MSIAKWTTPEPSSVASDVDVSHETLPSDALCTGPETLQRGWPPIAGVKVNRGHLFQLVWMSLLVFVSDWASHLISSGLSGLVIIWPSDAVMLWLAIRYGKSAIMPLFIGEEFFHHTFFSEYVLAFLFINIGNVTAAMVGAWIYLYKGGNRHGMADVRSVSIFLTYCIAASTLISAIVGVAALHVQFDMSATESMTLLAEWCFSGYTGAVLCLPALLTLTSKGGFVFDLEGARAIGLTIGTVIVLFVMSNTSLFSYTSQLPTVLFSLPVCIWLGLRTNTGMALLSLMALIFGSLLVMLFVFEDLSRSYVAGLQIYGCIMMVTAMFLNAMMNGRDLAIGRLAQQRDQLATMVKARTRDLSRQVEETQRLAARLDRQAHTDFLTKLPNRRAFIETADQRLTQAAFSHRKCSLLLIDVDHFKDVNDTYGHAAGDECLAAIAQALIRSTRGRSDYLARLGGEEFVCLLEKTDTRETMAIAERMRASVEAMVMHAGKHEIRTTISVGAVVVDSGTSCLGTFLQAADELMYKAKAQGRNRVELCTI